MRRSRIFKIGPHSIEHFEARPGVWVQDSHPQIQRHIFLCQDCEGQPDHYMLREDLWEQIVPQDGLICLSCLINRMGRPLVLEDLKDFNSVHKLPINRPIYTGFQMGLRKSIDSPDPLPIQP